MTFIHKITLVINYLRSTDLHVLMLRFDILPFGVVNMGHVLAVHVLNI